MSEKVLETCRKQNPKVKCMKLDVLEHPLVFQRIVDDLIKDNSPTIPSPQLVLFVDIGGTRELESLVALLPWL